MAGKSLKGSKSHDNLKEAFAGESQANRRYLCDPGLCGLAGLPRGGPPGRARARRVLGGDEGPAAPRPSRLTDKGRTRRDVPSGR